jgi:hypothetical protein
VWPWEALDAPPFSGNSDDSSLPRPAPQLVDWLTAVNSDVKISKISVIHPAEALHFGVLQDLRLWLATLNRSVINNNGTMEGRNYLQHLRVGARVPLIKTYKQGHEFCVSTLSYHYDARTQPVSSPARPLDARDRALDFRSEQCKQLRYDLLIGDVHETPTKANSMLEQCERVSGT